VRKQRTMRALPAAALVTALVTALLSACAPEDAPIPSLSEKVESPERIDSANDPNRFALDFARSFATLPVAGESLRKPFASNWWPMARGGITQSWLNGQPGPAQKYDQLTAPDRIRDVQLTLAQRNFEDMPVNVGAMPETMRLGPAAEWEHRNHGRYGATDPESWYGHCNGWSSYVLNEDEPIRPVSVRYDAATRRVTECANPSDNGCVRFELGDINALGAELYWSDGARMVGRRCEQEASEFTFDTSGRVNAIECRDGNAGTFHLVLTNMLGRLQRPFIVDLTADRQVWNYPVYRFQVLENQPVALAEALRLVGAPADVTTWTYNTNARSFVRIRVRAWIVEDSIPPTTQPAGSQLDRYTTLEEYEYVLELDASGNIDGGEWTGVSKTRHPDFLWYSFSNSAYPVSSDDLEDRDNTAIRYTTFKEILTLAQMSQPPPPANTLRVEARPNVEIPDNVPAGISSVIDVTETFSVARASVTVEITHPYRGDLRVVLTHGTREHVLHAQAGGSEDDVRLTLDLPVFAADEARGPWTLSVRDLGASDVGRLVRWSLDLTRGTVTPPPPPPPPPATQTFEQRPALAIPDNTPAGIVGRIEVSPQFTTTSVRVGVEITHTYRGDLRVTLVKGDRTIVLHNNTGGSVDHLRQTFDVPTFVGVEAAGAWELRVADTAATDTGTLDRWTIELGGSGGVTPPPPPPPAAPVTREVRVIANLAIPDNTPAGITSVVGFEEAIRIDTLRIEVNIAHTYVGDLTVVLEKDGSTQTLHRAERGSADDIRRTFDTLAFVNTSARGTWTLRVVDGAGQDVGTLESWRLIITGRPL